MLLMLMASCAAAAGPPLPGLDFLYSEHVVVAADGEPQVAVGIMQGQQAVTVVSAGVIYLDYFVDGQLRQSALSPDTPIELHPTASRPALLGHGVDVGGIGFGDDRALREAVERWRGRGYEALEVIDEGTILGLAGRVLDNRQHRLVIPTGDAAQAKRLARQLTARYRIDANERARLVQQPWGDIALRCEHASLPSATTYVRLRGDAPLVVQQVEFARGYSWHGREDRTYAGDLYVVVDKDGTLAVVNVVGAEEMLKGVVPSEMFASAPLEALKAQAIAARNHLLAKVGRRHHGEPFHLCAEQHCQVYSGLTRRTPSTDAAVDQTRGQVLFRAGTLVHAVYASSCGGHTEDNDVAWGEAPDPALRGRPDWDGERGRGVSDAFAPWVRATPTTYCNSHRLARADKFRWQRRIDATALRSLETRYPQIGALTHVETGPRGPGGKLASVTLVGEQGRVHVGPELAIRQIFGGLNAASFDMEEEHDDGGRLTALSLHGAGWGHGVGMCQMGAIGRAEAGQNYRRILAHYYSGAEPIALYGFSSPQPLQYRAAHGSTVDGWDRRRDGIR